MSSVASYKVGITRSRKGGPSRWLSLRLESSVQGVALVTLFFYEKETAVFGFVNDSASTLVANLPVAEFAPLYQILNTENPVYVHFSLDPEERKLLSLGVSTAEEPLGEGPVDRSP